MSDDLFRLWVYLGQAPLTWLTLTLIAWIAANRLFTATGRHPLLNPVLVAIILVAIVLAATATPYRAYFDGAQFVHFLLGPATVALAIPLVENVRRVRRVVVPMLAALFAGSLTAIVSAVGVAMLFGAPREILASLAPKSATSPIAMGLAERLGGIPTLTAVLVITTGIIGALVVTPLMNALGVRDYAARGFAVGVAAHGIGTARAFQVHPLAGTFAGIGMGLNGLVTSLLVPLLSVLLP